MNCEIYQDLVAAHVDGLLSPDEYHAVQEHLSSCQECQQLFAEQQAFTKAFQAHSLQAHSLIVPVPDELEHRLRATLAEDNTASDQTSAWRRIKDWFADRFATRQLPRFGLGLAAVGVVVALVLPRVFPTGVPAVSEWLGSEPNIVTSAVTSYQEMAAGNPSLTYPVQEPTQLEASFNRSGQLGFDTHVLDLRQVGFQLRGGTIRHTATHPMALAIYDNGAEHILCLRQQGQMPLPPAGGEWRHNNYLYTQGEYTVILTQFSDHFCSLVSRLPREAFLHSILGSAQ